MPADAQETTQQHTPETVQQCFFQSQRPLRIHCPDNTHRKKQAADPVHVLAAVESAHLEVDSSRLAGRGCAAVAVGHGEDSQRSGRRAVEGDRKDRCRPAADSRDQEGPGGVRAAAQRDRAAEGRGPGQSVAVASGDGLVAVAGALAGMPGDAPARQLQQDAA